MLENSLTVYVWFPAIVVLAFFLKGIAGTGTTTVIVSLSSLLIAPKSTVVLASFINIFGGFAMLRIDKVRLKKRYWVPVAVAMIVGSFIGAYMLSAISADLFAFILGCTFLVAGVWFLFFSVNPDRQGQASPASASLPDIGVGTFAGFCGGFIGINAPPLVVHFSKVLDKSQLRRLLIIIFIPAAITQTGTFYATGLLTEEILYLGLLLLPPMVLGIYLGNKAHLKISERGFRRVLGVFLVIVSTRLIMRYWG